MLESPRHSRPCWHPAGVGLIWNAWGCNLEIRVLRKHLGGFQVYFNSRPCFWRKKEGRIMPWSVVLLYSKVLRGGTKGWKPFGPLHANALWGHLNISSNPCLKRPPYGFCFYGTLTLLETAGQGPCLSISVGCWGLVFKDLCLPTLGQVIPGSC